MVTSQGGVVTSQAAGTTSQAGVTSQGGVVTSQAGVTSQASQVTSQEEVTSQGGVVTSQGVEMTTAAPTLTYPYEVQLKVNMMLCTRVRYACISAESQHGATAMRALWTSVGDDVCAMDAAQRLCACFGVACPDLRMTSALRV